MLELINKLSSLQRFLLALGVGLAITLTTGAVCGRISSRWGPIPDMVAAAKHVAALPETIGDWKMVKSQPMTDLAVRTLMCAGYVNRTYVNQKTGAEVSLALIVGPPGPTAVHTPEICYSSQAYSQDAKREAVSFTDPNGEQHSLWRLTFHANDPAAEQLCVHYAWSSDGRWQASESPRFEFAGKPMLYKIQMASPVPPGKIENTNPSKQFLDDLLSSGWKVTG
jgi:hypothetical protein